MEVSKTFTWVALASVNKKHPWSFEAVQMWVMLSLKFWFKKKKKKTISVAGTWTRVFRVRAEYPDQLDYNGFAITSV